MMLPFQVHEENGRFAIRDGMGDRYDILDDERAARRIAALLTVATELHRYAKARRASWTSPDRSKPHD